MPIRRLSLGLSQRVLYTVTAILVAVFLLGLIAGAMVIHALDPVQLTDLQQYLNSFLNGMGTLTQNGRFPALQAWGAICRTQLASLALFWLLGLCVVGVPLVLLVIGARGFVLGFTIGLLVQEKAAQGMLLALAAVLPQNLCYLPAQFGAGILAIYFTLYLCQGSRQVPVLTGIVVYTALFVALAHACPGRDLDRGLPCAWAPAACSDLLAVVPSTYPKPFPNSLFYSATHSHSN